MNVDRYREMTEKVRFFNMTAPSVIAANAAAQMFFMHVLALLSVPFLV